MVLWMNQALKLMKIETMKEFPSVEMHEIIIL